MLRTSSQGVSKGRKRVPKVAPPTIATLHDPVYACMVTYVKGTWEQFCAHLETTAPCVLEVVRRDLPDGSLGAFSGHTYPRTSGVAPSRASWFIFVDATAPEEEQLLILAHECLHCAIAVMELVGHNAGKVEVSEPLTYYFDWVLREGKGGLRL